MPQSSSLRKHYPLESLGNAIAKSGEIRVERIETRLNPRVPFPHRHDFYHLLFLERGSGWHEIEFVQYKVKPMQLFVMRPGEVHSWQLGGNTRGFVVEFTKASLPLGKVTQQLLGHLDSMPSMILPERGHQIASQIEIMLDEFQHQQAGFRLSLEHLLLALLVRLARLEVPIKKNGHSAGLVENFLTLVEKHFLREHAVGFYAEQLGVTTKSLTQQASKVLGKSAGTSIQERLLIEAKRLLVYSDLTVAEIGYELGYEDPNYFARFFRQHVGLAPGKYRILATKTIES